MLKPMNFADGVYLTTGLTFSISLKGIYILFIL